eukprot:TRINITY_DN10953_c0_g1_i1.p1 TRINITY_DN10953_c0_g1~~TRINITY_DN10953_c0_g1_i1.p1  ORF type:complete len:150 (-),score=31.61 TRINITY_DN10953_c0_g1_i1:51-500(-)
MLARIGQRRTRVLNIRNTPKRIVGDDSLCRNFHVTVAMLAVPKKKTSSSKKKMRNMHRNMKPISHYTSCSNCDTPVLLHNVCKYCGWYKGEPYTKKAKKKHELGTSVYQYKFTSKFSDKQEKSVGTKFERNVNEEPVKSVDEGDAQDQK